MREHMGFEFNRAGEWSVSSYCQPGSCVEVRFTSTGVLVRDSKDINGPILWFTDKEWTAFLAGARAGEFDLR